MPRRAKLRNQLLLQTKSTVIGGNSHAHILSLRSSRHHEIFAACAKFLSILTIE
jgi:hypothetical protein